MDTQKLGDSDYHFFATQKFSPATEKLVGTHMLRTTTQKDKLFIKTALKSIKTINNRVINFVTSLIDDLR